MAPMNVSLPEPMKAWLEAQVESGHYSNASDYVRALIPHSLLRGFFTPARGRKWLRVILSL